ncbi:MAG: saccharopine dehydrogenase NADP-binding domain-containing protein [Burkholderiales bacterium]|jgi:short subunit dehydrogenase-like uncharacterized protein|nr:saccharopine dehydrogenase NADP-binding domain-containing protein [Burkholderiales bacterium]
MPDREYDIVLYGATGFVGRQAAEYLDAQRAKLSFAVAGRDEAKLEAVRSGLKKRRHVGLIVADSRDAKAIDAMAARARVVLNAAGPFALYGDAVVDACVRAKTHYTDITGETPWVRSLIDRHHARAAKDGTRIVPFCGFDSVPSDLGTFLVVRRLQEKFRLPCRQVKAYFRMFGGFNGGTLASAMNLQESGDAAKARDPFLLDPPGKHTMAEKKENRDPRAVEYDADVGAWVGPFVMGPINTRVVRRSAALFARWGDPYGPRFRYQEYTRYGGRVSAALVTGAMGLFGVAIANDRARNALKLVLPKPGEGPSESTMNAGWFRTDLVATSDAGDTVHGRISHQGDPGNRATVRFVCESALALALDERALPGGRKRGGVLTPATGLGDALAARLRRGGVEIEID